MEWNVLYDNINSGTIEQYNVLKGHDGFIRDLRSKVSSKEEFNDNLRQEMMCHYWRRAEWEVVVCPSYGHQEARGRKIDIFDQLSLNWDRFVDYCWDTAGREE